MRPLTSASPGVLAGDRRVLPREPRTVVTSVPGCQFSAVDQPTALTQTSPLDQCPFGKKNKILLWSHVEPGKTRVRLSRRPPPFLGAASRPPGPSGLEGCRPLLLWRALRPGSPGVSFHSDLGYAFLGKKKSHASDVWAARGGGACRLALSFHVALHWKVALLASLPSAPRRRQCPVPVRP